MARPLQIDIVRRAYQLWELAGRPEGETRNSIFRPSKNFRKRSTMRGRPSSPANEFRPHRSMQEALPLYAVRARTCARAGPGQGAVDLPDARAATA